MKREQNLKAFCRGLDGLNVGSLIKRHSDIMKALFLTEKADFTSEVFFSLISIDRPKDESEERAMKYFKEFVVHIESE